MPDPSSAGMSHVAKPFDDDDDDKRGRQTIVKVSQSQGGVLGIPPQEKAVDAINSLVAAKKAALGYGAA